MRTSLPSPVPTAASPDPEGPGPQPALTRLLLVFQLLGPPALDLKIQEPQWGPENRLGSPGLVLGVGAVCPWPEHLGALRASTRGTGQGWYLQEVVFGLGVKVALNSPGGRTRLRGDRCRQGVRLPCLPGLPAPPGGMVPREPWVGGLTPAGDGPAEPSALRGGSEEPERGLGLCKDSAELKVAVRQVMEAAGAARPACGQKPQLSGAAATCPASRGRVGPAGPGPRAARPAAPPTRPGRVQGFAIPDRGRRVAAAQRTTSGRGAERGRGRLARPRSKGPGRAGAGAPRCGPGSVGARDVGRVVLGHPFPLAPAGAEQWGSHKRPGVHLGGPPAPTPRVRQLAHTGPSTLWPLNGCAGQKSPGQAWRSCCGLGLVGLPPQRQPGPRGA